MDISFTNIDGCKDSTTCSEPLQLIDKLVEVKAKAQSFANENDTVSMAVAFPWQPYFRPRATHHNTAKRGQCTMTIVRVKSAVSRGKQPMSAESQAADDAPGSWNFSRVDEDEDSAFDYEDEYLLRSNAGVGNAAPVEPGGFFNQAANEDDRFDQDLSRAIQRSLGDSRPKQKTEAESSKSSENTIVSAGQDQSSLGRELNDVWRSDLFVNFRTNRWPIGQDCQLLGIPRILETLPTHSFDWIPPSCFAIADINFQKPISSNDDLLWIFIRRSLGHHFRARS